MTWRALNSACQAYGSPAIDYERFAAQYDAEDETGILHQLVDSFDVNGLVIKTEFGNPQGGEQPGAEGSSDWVEKTAKSAAKRNLNK